MTTKRTLAAALLAASLVLASCAGQYRFSDDEYRPLGDPASIHRDK